MVSCVGECFPPSGRLMVRRRFRQSLLGGGIIGFGGGAEGEEAALLAGLLESGEELAAAVEDFVTEAHERFVGDGVGADAEEFFDAPVFAAGAAPGGEAEEGGGGGRGLTSRPAKWGGSRRGKRSGGVLAGSRAMACGG
jgi:hypothetical protein